MTLISTALCTQPQLERYLSANGVLDYADHDEDGTADVGVVDDSINQATEELLMLLEQRYTAADLKTSTLVNRWAVKVSAYFHCQLRGNPPPMAIASEFERILDTTNGLAAMVSNGLRQLPGLALRDDLRPTMSNLTIDRRWNRSTVRVTPQNSSTPPTKLTQDTTRDFPTVFD